MKSDYFLSDYEKGKVDAMKCEGHSNRQIAREIGRAHGSINRYFRNKEMNPPKRKRGRKPTLSPATRRRILKEVRKEGVTIKKIKVNLKLDVGRETIRKVIKSSSQVTGQKSKRQLPLTQRQKKLRLQWGREHMGWTEKWKSVIWSGVKMFSLDGPEALSCRNDLHTEPKALSRRPTSTGPGSVMVWTAFSFHGKSPLAYITKRQTSSEYQRHLETTLLPSFQLLGNGNGIFMQDGTGCHNARGTKDFLHRNNIPVMNWPPLSPDLNPIKSVWEYLAQNIYRNGRQFGTLAELKTCIYQEWERVPDKLLKKLCLSLPDRVFEVIYANGGSTNY